MLQQRNTQCPHLERLIPLGVEVRIGKIVTRLLEDYGGDDVRGQLAESVGQVDSLSRAAIALESGAELLCARYDAGLDA